MKWTDKASRSNKKENALWCRNPVLKAICSLTPDSVILFRARARQSSDKNLRFSVSTGRPILSGTSSFLLLFPRH